MNQSLAVVVNSVLLDSVLKLSGVTDAGNKVLDQLALLLLEICACEALNDVFCFTKSISLVEVTRDTLIGCLPVLSLLINSAFEL